MKKIILVSFLIGNSIFALAQWQQMNTPFGGQVNSIAISRNNIFAGTFGSGIFLSADSGKNWKPLNNGLDGMAQNVISVFVNGNDIYACSYGGFYFSPDNGENWSIRNRGLKDYNWVNAVAFDGNVIYAGTYQGIRISYNKGEYWDSTYFALKEHDITSLAINKGNIYAGTNGGGIFYSSDKGQNWKEINSGLKSHEITSLAVYDTNLYAGTSDRGIFISQNSGKKWESASNGLEGDGMIINSITANGNKMLLGTNDGVYFSENNGGKWINISSGITNKTIKSVEIAGTKFVAGTHGTGVFISSDNGQSWQESNNGLSAMLINTLNCMNEKIFIGTDGAGVFVSADECATWNKVNAGFANSNSYYINSFAFSGDEVYAGTDAGVYEYLNAGNTWKTIGLPDKEISAIGSSGKNLFAGTSDGLYVSNDNGENWKIAGFENKETEMIYIDSKSIFVEEHTPYLHKGISENALFFSDNNGKTWKNLLDGSYVHIFAVAGNIYYAGTLTGLFSSEDKGKSWMMSFYPDVKDTMFYWPHNLDEDNNCFEVINSEMGFSDVTSIIKNGEQIIIGLNGENNKSYFTGGVYMSTDNAYSWTALNDGIGSYAIKEMTISEKNIFALSMDKGIWKRVLAK